jgi:uncharacterized protein YciI
LQYFVHGVDDAGVDEKLEDLGEQHWAYMDRHAGQLVARGPTLTSDGRTHTGSVHVVEATTIEQARLFAFHEPYWLAGVYASVTVTRFQNALGGSMWDRPPAATGIASTLVLATWPAMPYSSADVGIGEALRRIAAQEPLVFGGVLVTEHATHSVGAVAAFDVDQAAAGAIMLTVGLPETDMATVSHRWQRGGRDQV